MAIVNGMRLLGSIRKACGIVYREKGPGFSSSIYRECLNMELAIQQIPFYNDVEMDILYRGQMLQQKFRADLICFQDILVDVRTERALDRRHRRLARNYLRATGLSMAALVNFGSPYRLQWEWVERPKRRGPGMG